MKKHKTVVRCPELTLRPAERRRRARLMAAMTVGTNRLSGRQIRRLPSRSEPSKHSSRQERRQMKRYARKQGLSVGELLA